MSFLSRAFSSGCPFSHDGRETIRCKGKAFLWINRYILPFFFRLWKNFIQKHRKSIGIFRKVFLTFGVIQPHASPVGTQSRLCPQTTYRGLRTMMVLQNAHLTCHGEGACCVYIYRMSTYHSKCRMSLIFTKSYQENHSF